MDGNQWAELMATVRIACYAFLGTAVVVNAARNWLRGRKALSAIHAITGFFLFSSIHYVEPRTDRLSHLLTSVVVVWVCSVILYVYRARRAKWGY